MQPMQAQETIYVNKIYQQKIDQDRFGIFDFELKLEECYPLKIRNNDMEYNAQAIKDMIREVTGSFPKVGHHEMTGQGFIANFISLDWYEDPRGVDLHKLAMKNWYMNDCVDEEPVQDKMNFFLVEKAGHLTFKSWWHERTGELSEENLDSDTMVTAKAWCENLWGDLVAYQTPKDLDVPTKGEVVNEN